MTLDTLIFVSDRDWYLAMSKLEAEPAPWAETNS